MFKYNLANGTQDARWNRNARSALAFYVCSKRNSSSVVLGWASHQCAMDSVAHQMCILLFLLFVLFKITTETVFPINCKALSLSCHSTCGPPRYPTKKENALVCRCASVRCMFAFTKRRFLIIYFGISFCVFFFHFQLYFVFVCGQLLRRCSGRPYILFNKEAFLLVRQMRQT